MCLLGQSIKEPPAPDSFSTTKMPTQLDLTRSSSLSSTHKWVEHDQMEMLETVRICMSKAIDKATVDGYNVDGGLKAIGLTN
ncbi:hypothetical protein ACSBR1_043578 [Camellia fascicularis]